MNVMFKPGQNLILRNELIRFLREIYFGITQLQARCPRSNAALGEHIAQIHELLQAFPVGDLLTDFNHLINREITTTQRHAKQLIDEYKAHGESHIVSQNEG